MDPLDTERRLGAAAGTQTAFFLAGVIDMRLSYAVKFGNTIPKFHYFSSVSC